MWQIVDCTFIKLKPFTNISLNLFFWTRHIDSGKVSFSRNLQLRSLQENDAIIFVVDSSDRNRFSESRNELLRILQLRASISDRKLSVPVLVLANKQDKESSTTEELSNILDLERVLNNCPWHILPTCALTGAGLDDGLAWLASKLNERTTGNK